MPEAAVVVSAPREPEELAAQAEVVTGFNKILQLTPEPLILAVAEDLVAQFRVAVIAPAAQAALASSSSSTTSALPQSSPSSHRRSGLHQRVR
jgi:hypothetical protein